MNTLYTQTSNTTPNTKLWEFSSNIYKTWASHLSNRFKELPSYVLNMLSWDTKYPIPLRIDNKYLVIFQAYEVDFDTSGKDKDSLPMNKNASQLSQSSSGMQLYLGKYKV